MYEAVGKYALLSCFFIIIFMTCAEEKSNDSSEDSSAETGDFVERLARGLCQWYISCGQGSGPEDLEDCIADLNEEITDDVSLNGQFCNAFVSYYTENRQALEACLQNPNTQCDNDDITTFCPAFASLDVNTLCQEEMAARNNDNNDSPQPNTERDFTPDVRTMIVGIWAGSWSCAGEEHSAQGEMYWKLCPNGKLRGVTTVETSRLSMEAIASGSYSINNADDEVSVSLVETVVNPSIIRGDVSTTELSVLYSSEDDALRVHNYCGFWMTRLEGGGYQDINNSDCESSASASDGGNDACGTDCDCGRCWYCESGTCRYGGEGPYGCYRGCE